MHIAHYSLAICLISLSAAALADSPHIAFRTPSGNIHCIGDRHWPQEGRSWAGVECQISEHSAPAPRPRPRDCELDWGSNFSLSRSGQTEMGCVGDSIAESNSRILHYGQTIRGQGWQCTSRQSGLSCRNSSGHGFELSRRQHRLF